MTASPEIGDRSTVTVIRMLAATLAVQALVTMAGLTLPVFAPAAAADMGIDPNHVGIFASILYAGAMTSSLLSGGFAPRYGAIRISQIALVIAAAGIAATTAAYLPLLILSAVALGVGLGPVTPASSHVLARHTPAPLRSLVFSIKQTGVPLGGALAGALVPLFVVEFGWRGAAWAVAAICLCCVVLIQPTRRHLDVGLKPRERLFPGSVIGPLKQVLADRGLRRPVLASFAYSAMQQSFSVFLVIYLVTALDMKLVQAGLALAVAQGAGVPGRIVWGALADLLGNARLVLGGLGLASAVSALAVASFTPEWSLGAILAVCACFGATAIGWNGVYLAEIVRIVPLDQASRATGGALFVTFFGVVAAPPVFGVLATMTGGYGIGFVALAVFTGISGLTLVLPRRRS